MSNFIEEYKRGRRGVNVGLPLGPGLEELTGAINGLQGGMIYTVASAPKVGKSTLVDYGFLVQAWLAATARGVPIRFVYYSFEIDRVSKEFDLVAMFLRLDHGLTRVEMPWGGSVPVSGGYLRGRVSAPGGGPLPIPDRVFELVKGVYARRVVPLFGEYAADGSRLREGACDVVERKGTVEDIGLGLQERLARFGTFRRGAAGLGYDRVDERQMVVIIIDHLRRVLPARGATMKQTIDGLLEREVELRNACGATFVNVIHMNRDLAAPGNLRLYSDRIFPTPENIKDSGNASEDSDYVLTMFNPNDDRYNLGKFFGHRIRGKRRERLYPELRSIHLVESRHTDYPRHILVNMDGAQKTFHPFVPMAGIDGEDGTGDD